MGRHERRAVRALVRLGRTTVQGTVSLDDVERAGYICAWRDCQATCEGGNLPKAWRCLLLFWAPRPVMDMTKIPQETWDRDGVLCPEHARALDGLLKDLARWTDDRPAGSA